MERDPLYISVRCLSSRGEIHDCSDNPTRVQRRSLVANIYGDDDDHVRRSRNTIRDVSEKKKKTLEILVVQSEMNLTNCRIVHIVGV